MPLHHCSSALDSVDYKRVNKTDHDFNGLEIKTRLRVRSLNSKMNFKRNQVIQKFANQYGQDLNAVGHDIGNLDVGENSVTIKREIK